MYLSFKTLLTPGRGAEVGFFVLIVFFVWNSYKKSIRGNGGFVKVELENFSSTITIRTADLIEKGTLTEKKRG